MERQPKAKVDFELDCADQPAEFAFPTEWHTCAQVLAAEVRALRVDARIYTRMELMLNQHMNGRTLEVWTHEHDQLLATLKRVEALPAKWRAREFLNVVDHHATYECANELEAALKGEP